MNNYNKERSGKGGRGSGRKGRGNRNFGYGQRRNNNGNERHFRKFADNDYKNHNNDGNYDEDPKYWPQNNNKNYNINNDRYRNNDVSAGILPWHRKTPIIPLVIPPQQLNDSRQDDDKTNNVNIGSEQIAHDNIPENVDNYIASEKRLDTSGNSVSITNTKVVSNTSIQQNSFTVKIKEEKQDVIKLKQEKKSSSSSSSSSQSSSSEDDLSNGEVPKQSQKTLTVKTAIINDSPNTKTPSSPLNIKLKSKANVVNETITSSTAKKKPAPASSSSSTSSSSEEEEEPPKPPPPTMPSKSAIKAIKTKLQKEEEKTKSSKKKRVSEEDVVCIGNLDNKIVLEDDSDEEESSDVSTATSPAKKKSKKTSKRTEKCMICAKKGHTSFQCQMVCKNCSAPYHGYRTCPHPANLNTMLQLFLDFCMQQFQQFTVAKVLDTKRTDSVPEPQVDSPSTHAANKTHKQKRKRSKTPETKAKSAKKRKLSVSAKKKILKEDNEESDTDSSESEEDTTESDNSTSSASLVSSKKKLKLKNKSSTKIPFNMPSFTPNAVNMPLVLNGFPTLTAGTAAVTNPNTSNNALNTLLLTQMFQNAIGSLK